MADNTIKKAIDRFSAIKEAVEYETATDPDIYGDAEQSEEQLENYYQANESLINDCDIAVQALQKQTPLKPIIQTRHRGGFEEVICEECGHINTIDYRNVDNDYAVCPVCDKHIDGLFRNYCDNCGQKIDWGETDKTNLSTENKEEE